MIGKYDQFNYGWDDVDAALIGEDIPYWRITAQESPLL